MVRAGGCGVHLGQFLMCREFALLLFARGKGDRASVALFGEYGGRFTPTPLIKLRFCRDIYGLYQLAKKKKKKPELIESFIVCTNFILFPNS
jgi:hypothetical protein